MANNIIIFQINLILIIKIFEIYKMNLADRDKIINLLQDEIKKNKNNVKTHFDALDNINNENKFLDNIKTDYKKYRNHMIDEKVRQKEFMKLLLEYIESVLDNSMLDEDETQRALLEQNRILKQIDHLKTELDDLVSNKQ